MVHALKVEVVRHSKAEDLKRLFGTVRFEVDPTSLDRLSALPVVVPTEGTWARVEAWTDRAAEAGERFGLADLLIASLAQDLGGLVWTFDQDFERMARLNMVQLYSA